MRVSAMGPERTLVGNPNPNSDTTLLTVQRCRSSDHLHRDCQFPSMVDTAWASTSGGVRGFDSPWARRSVMRNRERERGCSCTSDGEVVSVIGVIDCCQIFEPISKSAFDVRYRVWEPWVVPPGNGNCGKYFFAGGCVMDVGSTAHHTLIQLCSSHACVTRSQPILVIEF